MMESKLGSRQAWREAQEGSCELTSSNTNRKQRQQIGGRQGFLLSEPAPLVTYFLKQDPSPEPHSHEQHHGPQTRYSNARDYGDHFSFKPPQECVFRCIPLV